MYKRGYQEVKWRIWDHTARDLNWDMPLTITDLSIKGSEGKGACFATQCNWQRPHQLGNNIQSRATEYDQIAHLTVTDEVSRKEGSQWRHVLTTPSSQMSKQAWGVKRASKVPQRWYRVELWYKPRVSAWPHPTASLRRWAGMGFLSNDSHSQMSR